jgi:hypothetical protein
VYDSLDVVFIFLVVLCSQTAAKEKSCLPKKKLSFEEFKRKSSFLGIYRNKVLLRTKNLYISVLPKALFSSRSCKRKKLFAKESC